MARIDARLKALEAQEQAVRGIRIFQQDWEDVHTYYEGIDNQRSSPFTKADISVLSTMGWQTLLMVYGSWPPFATEE